MGTTEERALLGSALLQENERVAGEGNTLVIGRYLASLGSGPNCGIGHYTAAGL